MYRITLALHEHDAVAYVQKTLEHEGYLVSINSLRPIPPTYPDMLLSSYLPSDEWQRLQVRYEYCRPLSMIMAPTIEHAIMALDAGADDAVSTPFSVQELLARIALRLRQRKMPSHLLRMGPLLMDTLRYTVLLYNQPLNLSPLEMRLLEVFLEAQGQPLSKPLLYQKVWQTRYTEGDRAIDPTIRRLRAKLGEMGDALETVRNYGYCLHESKEILDSHRLGRIDSPEAVLPTLPF